MEKSSEATVDMEICPVCGAGVSSKAETCPHCGHPLGAIRRQTEWAKRREISKHCLGTFAGSVATCLGKIWSVLWRLVVFLLLPVVLAIPVSIVSLLLRGNALLLGVLGFVYVLFAQGVILKCARKLFGLRVAICIGWFIFVLAVLGVPLSAVEVRQHYILSELFGEPPSIPFSFSLGCAIVAQLVVCGIIWSGISGMRRALHNKPLQNKQNTDGVSPKPLPTSTQESEMSPTVLPSLLSHK